VSQSQILRIPSGYVNVVNDAAIGMATAPPFGPSPFAGQLGKFIDFDTDNVRYNSAVGTVYQGRGQYVQLSAASLVPVVGQLLFWDTTVAQSFFRVTTDITLSSSDSAVMIAGVCLSKAITVGNYTLIQVPGNGSEVNVMCRAVLSNAGAIGSRLFATAAGGADLGFVDVVTASTTTLTQALKIGDAIGLPVGGSLVLARLVDNFGT
jgi:hypothetical protein